MAEINMVIVNCDGLFIEYEWETTEKFLADMRSDKEEIPMLDDCIHTLYYNGGCYNEMQLEEIGIRTVNDFYENV